MKYSDYNPIIEVENDGLEIPEVGEWAQEKYKLVGFYCNIFTKSMIGKWDNLVYLDLFSGSGYSSIRNSKKIIKSSPLISLSIPFKFTKYIFCEKDEYRVNSLNERIKRDYKDINFEILKGDTNQNIDLVISKIPRPSKLNTVLTFCFADIFSMNNLHFSTIRKLSSFALDFLILLPLGMDAKRNFTYYLNNKNNIVDLYLGDNEWRNKFMNNFVPSNSSFIQFINEEYKNKLISFSYQNPEHFHEIRSIDKNLPLYHLAFFSKNKLGNYFWKEIKKSSNKQLSFGF